MSARPTSTLPPEWASSEGLSANELRERRLAVLASLRELHSEMLAERGGEPIPTAVIDRMLDEIRGRVDADID